MANEVQIIISAVDKASAEMAKLDSSTKKFALGLAAVGTAAIAVGREVQQIVNETVEYGKQVDDLSRSLGINAEESSKLIQIADDLRIDVGTLKMGFKAALKEGVTPNIEGIKGLAKEYQALDSPVEKAQFSMKYFGRAGLELNKILELTPDKLDAMARSAEAAGLVLGTEDVEATKRLWSEMDSLNDSVDGVKTQLAIGLIPALADTAAAANELIMSINDLNSTSATLDAAYETGNITWGERIQLGWEMLRGTIDQNTVTQLQIDTQRTLSQEYTEGLRRTVDYTTGTQSLNSELDTLRMRTTNANDGFIEFGYAGEDVKVALQKDKDEAALLQARFQELQSYMDGQLGPEYEDFTQKNEDLRAKSEELRAKIQELEAREYLTAAQKEDLDQAYTDLEEVSSAMTANADAHDEATSRILFNMAAQRLAIDGFNEDEIELLDNLAKEWGLIDDKTYEAAQAMAKSLKEFAESGDVDAAIESLNDVKKQADAIPRNININIHVSKSGVDLPKNWGGPGQPKQFGGPVWAGVPYMVGEGGPEMFVPNTSGQIVNNWNLTINEAGKRGNVVMDFALMQALARA